MLADAPMQHLPLMYPMRPTPTWDRPLNMLARGCLPIATTSSSPTMLNAAPKKYRNQFCRLGQEARQGVRAHRCL